MKNTLEEKLLSYSSTNYYPFHMPGHKRNQKMPDWNVWSMDLTEIDGFDDLYHPKGILKEAMERAAKLFLSEQTYFLVNGSTCGILSAISAALKPKEKILMARNSHRSAYHAVALRNLEVFYLYPEFIPDFGIYGGIRPETVQKELERNPFIKAVFLTSPTYEGLTSPIGEIAKIVHAYGAILIIDEAHGPHFLFDARFPQPALKGGADLVIHSLHKTLPALTQTALLHVQGNRVDRKMLQYYLETYQTSSPSYILMASIDHCISYLSSVEGREEMVTYGRRLEKLRIELNRLIHIKTLNSKSYPHYPQKNKDIVDNVDISKLVMRIQGYPIRGKEFYNILREEYNLQLEMNMGNYVLAMTSVMDEEIGYQRLFSALADIDLNIEKISKKYMGLKGKCFISEDMEEQDIYQKRRKIEAALTIAEALSQEKKICDIKQAEKKISGEFLYVYPPGVPFLAPGERIDGECLEQIIRYQEMGYEIHGLVGAQKDQVWVI